MVVAFDQGATDVCVKNGVVTMPADEQMETAYAPAVAWPAFGLLSS